MAQEFNNADNFVDQVKEYLNTRLTQLKLSFAGNVSKVMAILIAAVVSALVFFLFFVLLSVAGAIAIGQWLGNYWLGFIIIAAVILFVGFILWIAKDSWLRKPIMNALIKAMFDKEENEKDQNHKGSRV
jgi:ABC-type multidrug transport system permease subunit